MSDDRYHPLQSDDSRSRGDSTIHTPPAGISPTPTPPVSPPGRLQPTTDNAGKKRTVKHSRPSSRVKFTTGGDDSSDSESESLGEGSSTMPQRPRATHSPTVSPVEHSSQDISPFPPLAEEEDHPENATSQGIDLSKSTSSGQKGRAITSAYQRAQSLASRVRRPSFFTGTRKSDADEDTRPLFPPPPAPPGSPTNVNDSIPLENLDEKARGERPAAVADTNSPEPNPSHPSRRRASQTFEAGRIVRQMTLRDPMGRVSDQPPAPPSDRGDPFDEEDLLNHIAPPGQYRMGILANLLKLYGNEERNRQQPPTPPTPPPPQPPPPARPHLSRGASYDSSGRNTPRPKTKWYEKSPNQSTASLIGMTPKSSPKHSPSPSRGGGEGTSGLKRSKSSGMLAKATEKLRSKPNLEDEIRITVHIAAILSRQRYLTKLCEALMRYGAPTHRLEEYLTMTARVLEIDAQFLYLPGCMFVSFGDSTTHTTELRLLRHAQGVDLGKLADVHEIYKEVVHDVIGVEEATARLDAIVRRKQKFNVWWLIFLYGCASATVGPFAFSARPVDMPISFLLGCLLGVLHHLATPRSVLYANVFELTAAMATSFLARAFGSIPYKGEKLFCFSALAQSSIALILPGYIVLASSLELQSRNLLAGSVRLVFAIIYSLVLGFGLMLGTTFYGSVDANASTAYTCPQDPSLNEYTQRFPFVILFTLCLILINQAKWKQAPMMIVTSFTGYLVNFFSARHFSSNTQIANALGAFVIGVIGNLYSRIHHGLAAAAMLPAIFVQVPSGLAATGSLISGLKYANEITGHESDTTNSMNGNPTPSDATDQMSSSKVYGNMVFDLGYGMVQVSLAITVGLFLAALVVYPLGKRRSGLFSF